MKLIVLYGPPASGKLTVARALSEQTKIPLFHNHHSVDIAKELFPMYSPEFYAISGGVRYCVLETAVKNNLLAMIHTWCYGARDAHNKHIRKVMDIVEGAGGEMCFIQLTCSQETLYARVDHPDRCKNGVNKVTNPKNLDRMLERGDYFATLPFGESFVVNTDELSAVEAAKAIAVHFAL